MINVLAQLLKSIEIKQLGNKNSFQQQSKLTSV